MTAYDVFHFACSTADLVIFLWLTDVLVNRVRRMLGR
jgi:hypothetical protein